VEVTIKDGGLISIKVVDLPLNKHYISLGMESILAVLVESLLNKERLARPWTYLSYENGNCCNMYDQVLISILVWKWSKFGKLLRPIKAVPRHRRDL
jgi:hypothetical protein